MSPAAPVVGRVLKLANEVHGLARTAGRADLQRVLAEQGDRWGDAAATVVLAGAQRRGKSRLLNALVGRPGLLPVDADVATGTPVVLHRGDATRVVVHRTADPPTGPPPRPRSTPRSSRRSRPPPVTRLCCGGSPASRWRSTNPSSTACAWSTRRGSTG